MNSKLFKNSAVRKSAGDLVTTTKTYTLYRIFVVGFVEPQLFVDSRSLEELTSKWIVSRQVLDALEDKYESDYERYSQELEKNIGVEELAVPRPDKVTITEDVLLTFSGDERGVRGGSVLVGTISGIQKMSEGHYCRSVGVGEVDVCRAS